MREVKDWSNLEPGVRYYFFMGHDAEDHYTSGVFGGVHGTKPELPSAWFDMDKGGSREMWAHGWVLRRR